MTNEQAVVDVPRVRHAGALLNRVAEVLGVPPLRIEAAFAQMFGVV